MTLYDQRDLFNFPHCELSSTNKTDCHNITEMLLKVALITINHQSNYLYLFTYVSVQHDIQVR